MRLQESGEMYLETLYILLQNSAQVRQLDIANHMNFSKPSVNRAIGLLRDDGYVTSDENGFLHLTEAGRRIAAKTYERHIVLTQFFVRLGVPEAIAAEDACKIEHDISDTTFAALKKHAGLE